MVSPKHCVVQVSRAALSNNFALAKHLAGKCGVIAVVKSNGYGVGALPIAQHLSAVGARNWAVSNMVEAVELRRAGINGEIIVLGHFENDDAWLELAFKNDCCVSISCLEDVCTARDWCRRSNRSLRIQLQIEIGMKRLGVVPEHIDDVVSIVRRERLLRIAGVYGHPPSTSLPSLVQEHQRFTNALQNIRKLSSSISSHFASSAALMLGVGVSPHQYVRLGISLLGGLPSLTESGGARQNTELYSAETEVSERDKDVDWQSVVTISTQIVQIQRLGPGETVSYDGHFCAVRPTVVAVIPVGYADGIPACLSNQLIVTVRNRPVKQIGKITMNYLMIDVTDIDSIQVGELAIIGSSIQPFRDLAKLAGQLPHELLSRLSPFAPRCLV